MVRQPGPVAPRLTPPALVDLQLVEADRVVAGDDLDGADVDHVDLTGRRLREVMWRESRLVDVAMDDVDLRGARLLDVHLESMSATAISAPART